MSALTVFGQIIGLILDAIIIYLFYKYSFIPFLKTSREFLYKNGRRLYYTKFHWIFHQQCPHLGEWRRRSYDILCLDCNGVIADIERSQLPNGEIKRKMIFRNKEKLA